MNTIWVTFQRKGFHKYPAAPSEVAYLQTEHRHLFKFKVRIEIFHDDREIEFHMFLNWIETLYDSTLSLDYKSCEMICDDLAAQITGKYPDRFVEIDVSEDGECGATCEYNEYRKYLNTETTLVTRSNVSDLAGVQVMPVTMSVPKMQAIRVEPAQTIPVQLVEKTIVCPSQTQISLEQTGIPAWPRPETVLTQQTIGEVDVIMGPSSAAVYPEAIATVVPLQPIYTCGINAVGTHIKYENNIFYSSEDGTVWRIAKPELDTLIVKPY